MQEGKSAVRRFAIVLAVSTGLFAAPAQARDPLVLAPSSGWAMLNDGQRCKLVRNFGTGEDLVQMELRYFNPGPHFQLVAAGKPLEAKLEHRKHGDNVRFLPNGDREHSSIGNGELPDGTPLIAGGVSLIRYDVDLIDGEGPAEEDSEEPTVPADMHERDSERLAEITGLQIDGPYDRPIFLKTGAMTQPMELLVGCVEKLLSNFGLDVKSQKNLAAFPEPKGDPFKWFVNGARGYPEKMLRESKVGSISFRLLVDAEGKPTKCDVLDAAQGETFSQHTCKTLLRYARFEPARDMEGRPVASFYGGSVTFTF